MANDIKTKIELEGGKEYRQQLNQINAEMRALKAEGKEVASAYDKQDKSEEKVTKTTKNLNEQMELQKKKIELIKTRLAESEKAFGANDSRTLKLRESLAKANTEYNKMQSELDKVSDGLDDAAENTSVFGDVLKADLLSSAIQGAFNALTGYVKEFASGMIDAAATVRAERSAFSQAFGDMAEEADQAIARVANASGILQTRLTTAGTSIYAFARSSGGDATTSLTLMERALQAAADSAAYYDSSLEETTERLMAFMKGNFANDAALGVSATETTRNAAAMEEFGKKYAELTEIQKQQTLLKMVTDAQALSGAMGQAAREADGWENVQGNLTETWRQFQATVGEGFLDALVPILQEITKRFTEWKDSVDWEAFGDSIRGMGEKVADVIFFLLDNLPQVTATVVTLVTALSAVKLVSSVKNLTSAFSDIGKSLASANPTMIALGAALAVAAAVIPLFAGGLSEAGEQIVELSDEAQKATDRVEEFNDAMDAKNIIDAADRAEEYLDRLEELETQGLKTADANEEYQTIIKNLNSEFPELNLSIDETTGLLDQEASAVRKSISEWEKTATVSQQVKALQARQEELNKVTSERIRNENSLRAAEEQHASITAQMEEIQRQYEEAMSSGSSTAKTLEEQYNTLSAELEENETSLDALTESVNKGEEAEASLRAEIDEGTKAIGMSSDELENYQDSVDNAVDKNDELTESLDEVGSSAEENFKRFENSLSSVDDVVAVSYDEMIEILESQIKFMEDYEENLSSLYNRNVEGLDEMLSAMDDGSEESAAWFAGMVDQTDEELGEVVATWRKRNGQVKGEAASQGRGAAIALEGAYARMQESGSYLISGVISGMERKRQTLYSTSASLARVAHRAFNYVAQIKSPSRLFAESGRYLVEGIEMGINQETPNLESTLNSLADQAYLAFQMPDLTASGTMQTNNSYDQRVFTPNIVVNAAEGQSAEEVAEMVMDKIQNSYESREAVYA